jgi:hypothetical protein
MLTDETKLTLQRELALVEAAINTVADAESPRITLSGLVFGSELLPTAERLARRAGVYVRPLWNPDDSSPGLVVERSRDG